MAQIGKRHGLSQVIFAVLHRPNRPDGWVLSRLAGLPGLNCLHRNLFPLPPNPDITFPQVTSCHASEVRIGLASLTKKCSRVRKTAYHIRITKEVSELGLIAI